MTCQSSIEIEVFDTVANCPCEDALIRFFRQSESSQEWLQFAVDKTGENGKNNYYPLGNSIDTGKYRLRIELEKAKVQCRFAAFDADFKIESLTETVQVRATVSLNGLNLEIVETQDK